MAAGRRRRLSKMRRWAFQPARMGPASGPAEIAGLTYHQLFGVPFVSLRLFNVYGPRLRPELALAAFTRAILEGTPLTLYGDGSVLRDFTHVSDICRGVIAALTAPNVAGQCINLGNDQPIPIRRLIELIEKAAGVKAMIDHRPPRAEDMPFTHADLAKARRLLGYQPRVEIEAGVREYVEWFRGEQLSVALRRQAVNHELPEGSRPPLAG